MDCSDNSAAANAGGRNATGAPPGLALASMLDLNGNDNVLDDVMRMAGKAMR